MHTSEHLRSDAFAITLGGARAGIGDVLPGFDDQHRLGVVVRSPCGGVGASMLLLAATTAFYDAQRSRGAGFYIYPDNFLFHVGGPLGDHSMLDVWPAHKEVVVAAEPELLLEAINDRAITWLLVEDREPGEPRLRPETLASARGRIRGAFAYSPAGRVHDADLLIAGNRLTESFVEAVLDPEARLAAMSDTSAAYATAVEGRVGEVEPGVRARIRRERRRLREGDRAVESYRRLSLYEGLALL